MQIIIPMSGFGKRFIQAGYSSPKPLIEVDEHPMIKHVVDLFPEEKDVSFICNDVHLRETNIKSVLQSLVPDCKIYEVKSHSQKGPVEVVMRIADNILDDEEVIVSYCDYGTKWNYSKFLQQTRQLKSDGAIPCYIGFHPHMLGTDHYAYVKNKEMSALQISEKKPFGNNKMEEYASNGTYYFKNGAILKKYFSKLIESGQTIKDEYYVSMAYNDMINDGLKVSIFEIDKMLQWGTPYDLEIYKQWSQYFKDTKENPLKEIVCPKDTTLILPMAGKGSRFVKDGFEVPKPLIDVDGKPMVVRAVECLPKSENVIFGCLDEHIQKFSVDRELIKSLPNSNIVNIKKVTEGQACTCELMIEESQIDKENPILISACDNGAYYNTDEMQKLLDDNNIDVIVWSFRNHQTSKNNPDMYAWLKIDEQNLIQHVSCKKFIYDDPLKTHAIIGTMFFRKAKYFLDGLKENYKQNIRTNNEFYVDDVLNQNIKDGLKVKVFEVKNYICWGTPNDYKTYNYWKEVFLDGKAF